MTFFLLYAFQRHVNTLYTREFVFASSFLITLTFSAPIRSFARVDLHFSLSYSFWFVLLSCVWPGSEKKLFNVRTYKIIPASLFRGIGRCMCRHTFTTVVQFTKTKNF